jgi:hypothetical protein
MLATSSALTGRLPLLCAKHRTEQPMPKKSQREAPAPKRERLNSDEKVERKAAAWQLFIKSIGRKAQRGVEPNDRKHSIRMDKMLRRMPPEDFDRLIRYGEED